MIIIKSNADDPVESEVVSQIISLLLLETPVVKSIGMNFENGIETNVIKLKDPK